MKEHGKWITINGAHVWIEPGETVEHALAEKEKTDKWLNVQQIGPKTYRFPSYVRQTLIDDVKRYNKLYGTNYQLKMVDMKDIIKDTGIDKSTAMADRRTEQWGTNPDEYKLKLNKIDNEISNPIRLSKVNGKYRIEDGNHRLRALANGKYDKVEVLVAEYDK